MPLAIFSMLHIVSYVFEGLIILIALEASFGWFNGISMATAPIYEDAPILVAVILAHALGQANSTVAHLVFQDAFTSIALGRPSKYFLANISRSDADLDTVHRLFGSRLLHRLIIGHWKAFGENDNVTRELASFALKHNIEVDDERYDRKMFAIAFSKAAIDKDFMESTQPLLVNFNFSRNMFCAFLLSFVLLATSDAWKMAMSEGETNFLTEFSFLATFLVVMLVLFRRYLYFMGVFTKSVLVHLVAPGHSG